VQAVVGLLAVFKLFLLKSLVWTTTAKTNPLAVPFRVLELLDDCFSCWLLC